MLTTEQTSQVELSRAALVALLDRAKHVVPARCPKPILTCVRLEVTDGFLSVQATDGDLSLFTQLAAGGVLPTCVVPLAELIRRLKASRHATCSLALDGDRLLINGGRVGHALQTLDAADFPVVPSDVKGDSIELDASEFVHAVKVASHAVAREATRYAIDGILLESDAKGSRLVATDGRRMVVVELRNAGQLDDKALLPHRFCKLAEKLTDRHTEFLSLWVHREESESTLPARIFAAGPDWVLSTFECEGSFPVYRDVVPQSHSKFCLDREQLVETLAEVSLATNIESRMVRLDFGPTELALSAEAPGVGASEAKVPATFLGGGDAVIRTGFNPSFLLTAIKTLDGASIVIDVAQNGCGTDRKVFSKPALIYDRYDPAVRWVLMPINAGLDATRENLGSNYARYLELTGEEAASSV